MAALARIRRYAFVAGFGRLTGSEPNDSEMNPCEVSRCKMKTRAMAKNEINN